MRDNRDPVQLGLAYTEAKRLNPDKQASWIFDNIIAAQIISLTGETSNAYNVRAHYHRNALAVAEVQNGRFIGQARKTS